MSTSVQLDCTPSQQRKPLEGGIDTGESPGIQFDLNDLSDHEQSSAPSTTTHRVPVTPSKRIAPFYAVNALSPGTILTPSKRPGNAVSPTSASRKQRGSVQAALHWEEIVSAHNQSAVDGHATPTSHDSSFSFDVDISNFAAGVADDVPFGCENGAGSGAAGGGPSLWNWGSGGGGGYAPSPPYNQFGAGSEGSLSDTLDMENDDRDDHPHHHHHRHHHSDDDDDLLTPRGDSALNTSGMPRTFVDVDALVALDSPDCENKHHTSYHHHQNEDDIRTASTAGANSARRRVMMVNNQHTTTTATAKSQTIGGVSSTLMSPTASRGLASTGGSQTATPITSSSAYAFMNGRRVPRPVGATPTNTETPNSTRCASPEPEMPSVGSRGMSPVTTTSSSLPGKSTGFQLSVAAAPFPVTASAGSISSVSQSRSSEPTLSSVTAGTSSGRRLPVLQPGVRQPVTRRSLEGADCPARSETFTYQNYVVQGPAASSPNAAYHSVVLELKARRRVRCRIAVTMVDRILTQLRRNMTPAEAEKAGPTELVGTYLIFQPDQSSVEGHIDAGLCVGIFTSRTRNLIPVRNVGFTDCATVLRVASGEDCEIINNELPTVEEQSMQFCQEIVESMYLPLVCVDAECAFDKKLIRIFYNSSSPQVLLHTQIQQRLTEQLGMRVSFQCIKPEDLDAPPMPYPDPAVVESIIKGGTCTIDCVTGQSISSSHQRESQSPTITTSTGSSSLRRTAASFSPSPAPHVDPLSNEWSVVSQKSPSPPSQQQLSTSLFPSSMSLNNNNNTANKTVANNNNNSGWKVQGEDISGGGLGGSSSNSTLPGWSANGVPLTVDLPTGGGPLRQISASKANLPMYANSVQPSTKNNRHAMWCAANNNTSKPTISDATIADGNRRRPPTTKVAEIAAKVAQDSLGPNPAFMNGRRVVIKK